MTFLKKNSLIMAPMAGITDTVFRALCKRMGADVVVSEMVSADGLHYNSKNTEELMKFDEGERPIGIQLFGANAEYFAEAARFAEEKFKPDFIDLNSGCPVNKVVRKNGGSALLKDPALFREIVKAMTSAVKTPVTVKIRSGWNKYEWIDTDFAKMAEDNGAAAVTVHPRSQTMMFTGHSFWERIAEVKNVVKIPVIGNGDVISGESALRMIDETGCDALMIGRAALGNPWIFSEIKSALMGEEYHHPTTEERGKLILDHVKMYREIHGERKAVGEMKKHVAWYVKGLAGAGELKKKVFAAAITFEIEEIVKKYFLLQ